MSMSRAQFISRGAGSGVALVSGGALLASAATPAAAQTRGDIAIAQLAATAELLVIDFLQRALRADTSLNASVAREVLADERKHYRTFKKLLGDKAPTSVNSRFPSGTFDSAESIARLGFALDTAFTRVYIAAASALSSNELQALAAGLAANEAQHLSVWSSVLDRGLIPLPAIPKPLSPRAARRRLAPFIQDVDSSGAQLTG